MSVLRDVFELVDPPVMLPGRLRLLVDEKAWQHLGLTCEEFRRRWYAREYDHDLRDDVRALDQLLRSGRWDLDGSSSPGTPQ